MPPTADTKPGGVEDCKVCKKGKQSTAAFGALLAQRGMSIPGAGTDKQTGTLLLHTVFLHDFGLSVRHVLRAGGKASPVTECLSHTSSSAGVGCPADSEGLGRAGWTVLHTMVTHTRARARACAHTQCRQQPTPLRLELRSASSHCLPAGHLCRLHTSQLSRATRSRLG